MTAFAALLASAPAMAATAPHGRMEAAPRLEPAEQAVRAAVDSCCATEHRGGADRDAMERFERGESRAAGSAGHCPHHGQDENHSCDASCRCACHRVAAVDLAADPLFASANPTERAAPPIDDAAVDGPRAAIEQPPKLSVR